MAESSTPAGGPGAPPGGHPGPEDGALVLGAQRQRRRAPRVAFLAGAIAAALVAGVVVRARLEVHPQGVLVARPHGPAAIGHGDDGAWADGATVVVCDGEADGNPVRLRAGHRGSGRSPAGAIEIIDVTGGSGQCRQLELPSEATTLQLCERNLLRWVCSNQINTPAP